MSHSYKDLIAWQKAKSLAVSIYEVTTDFPKREWYGLTAQLRKAAVSIPSNIAEGQGRLSKRDFLHFLAIARGSLLELQTQLAIALDLGYLKQAEHDSLERQSSEVLRILNGLMESISPEHEAARV